MKLTINNSLKAGIVLMILAIAAVLFISIRQSQQVVETSKLVSHTQEVLFHIQKLELFGADNETGARRYLLSPSDDYLQSVVQSKKDILEEVRVLKALVDDNASQSALADSMKVYVEKRVDFSEQTIKVRNNSGLAVATTLVNTGLGKFYSDQIRSIGDAMQRKENELLTVRKKHNEESVFNLSLILYCVLGSTFLLSVYIINRVAVNLTKRTEVEQKLRESEMVFSTLFYKSPIMKAIAEVSNGRYINVNESFAKFMGLPKEEIIGKNSLELDLVVKLEDRQLVINDLLKNGFVRNAETPVKTRSGETRWLSTNIDLMDLYGKKCYLTAAVDITQRKQIEERLLKFSLELEQKVRERTEQIASSEARYRHLFENNPMPMWVIDVETFRFLDVNEMAVMQYGYSREEFLSMTALDIRPEDERELFRNSDHGNQSDSSYNRGVWTHRKKNGHLIKAEIVAHDINYEGRKARFILSNDVTEKKKAEEKLMRSEELYRSLFENMLHGFAYCQAIFKDNKLEDFKYLVVNSKYESLIGVENIAGKRISEALPQVLDSDPTYRELITSVVLTGKPERFETLVAPLGKWFQVSLYSPEHGYFVILQDNISERKIAEQKIKDINVELEQRVATRTEELRKINDELEAFSYSVSHDLRAPLRGIIGFSNILEEEYGNKLDEEARRVISIIKNNTSRMGQLIDDLLRFSRTSRHTIVKSDIDMDGMMRQVVTEQDKKENGKSIEWHLQNLPPVKGDASMIKQVWTNLVSNAVKYSNNSDKQVIEIGTKPNGTDESVTYFVKDNGVGFDANYSDKLFKVFQRLHSSEEFEGTGVGLAIVDKIISKHGGKVWAEAETGKGATFYFNLPAGTYDKSPLQT